jgi:hypothetical protein
MNDKYVKQLRELLAAKPSPGIDQKIRTVAIKAFVGDGDDHTRKFAELALHTRKYSDLILYQIRRPHANS